MKNAPQPQNRTPPSKRAILLLVVMVVAGLVLRGLLVSQDIETLLSKALSDDAYYYFALAKNVVEGKGVVFNEGIPTNGFHPLYALVLVPLFALTLPISVEAPIQAALGLLALFNALTAVFIFLILKELVDEKAGLLGAFLWLFNPYVLFPALMGLEMPIHIFLVAWLGYLWVKRGERAMLSVGEAVGFGALIGLVTLSRVEGALLGMGLAVSLALKRWRANGKRNALGALFNRDIVLMAGVAVLIALPWFLWSYLAVGRLTPVSGEALRLLRLLDAPSYPRQVLSSIAKTVYFVGSYFLPPSLVSSLAARVAVGGALGLIVLVLLVRRNAHLLALVRKLDFLWVTALFYYPLLWFYQLGSSAWYSLNTSLLLTLVTATLLTLLVRRLGKPKATYAVLVVALGALFVVGGMQHYRQGNFPQEQLKRLVGLTLDASLPADAQLGSFNTGIYQYYTENFDVINLDGVMNPQAYQALKDGQIGAYIRSQGLTHLVDRSTYLVNRLEGYDIELELLESFTVTFFSYDTGVEQTKTYGLYRIVTREGE